MILCFLTSMRLIEKKPDYSGTWKLDAVKSNFGQLSSAGVGTQLTIKQYSDKLVINRLFAANDHAGAPAIDTFKFNVRKEPVADMFRNHIAYTGWADDGKQLTKILFVPHKGSDNNTYEEKALVAWSLSEGGKTLIIDEEITIDGFMHTFVKLVYNKQ